jgi:hypothetical protein
MGYLDDVIKQVRDHDAAKPRSRQAEVGWSEVGGCRAALGFRLDGAFVTDDPDTWGAQRGTAIHEYLERIIGAAPYAAYGDGGVSTEVPTEYRGIPGHADIVGRDYVTDIKTTSLANALVWAATPEVLRQKRIQAHGYAAGLVDAGELPDDCTVRLLIIPVDGKFSDWFCYEEPFDRTLADEGADRLDYVRDLMAAGEPLPKDKPYAWCESWCPFFSLCREERPETEAITDPELAAAVVRYGEINEALRPLAAEKEGLGPVIRGLRGTAGDWRIGLSKPGELKKTPDLDAIRRDYAGRGEELPETWKPGAPQRLNVTRIKPAKAVA